MQIDVGFGDIVHPKAMEADLPTILDMAPPRLLCYSRESAIAEKFEAMVKLGMLNSRMKDFYDIWLLLRQFDFDGPKRTEAIRLTFERRGTTLPDQVKAFDQAFIDAKQIQWLAFWKRLQQEHVPNSFVQIVLSVEGFLSPVLSALFGLNHRPIIWTAPGPWAYS